MRLREETDIIPVATEYVVAISLWEKSWSVHFALAVIQQSTITGAEHMNTPSPACSSATMVDCSMRSRSMKLRKSSLYTLRSGSWKVYMGISRGSCSLVHSPVTCIRARDMMAELACEIPRERRFSVAPDTEG